MDFLETITAIPAITALCYLAADVYKAIAPETLLRHIPVICGVAGLLLGVAAFFLFPGYLPAENLFAAAAIGAVSGWAATGVDQTIKKERGQ